MLVHLPDGYKAERVRDAPAAKIQTIPDILRASVAWDQGPEMREWKQISLAADIDIYFFDPHAPRQRGTSEITNGLLRQSFPKGTDLSIHSAMDLDWVATELNDRPANDSPSPSQSRRSDSPCCNNRQNPRSAIGSSRAVACAEVEATLATVKAGAAALVPCARATR